MSQYSPLGFLPPWQRQEIAFRGYDGDLDVFGGPAVFRSRPGRFGGLGRCQLRQLGPGMCCNSGWRCFRPDLQRCRGGGGFCCASGSDLAGENHKKGRVEIFWRRGAFRKWAPKDWLIWPQWEPNGPMRDYFWGLFGGCSTYLVTWGFQKSPNPLVNH